MTLKPATYYEVHCDACGAGLADHGSEYCSWGSASLADESWVDSGNVLLPLGRHACGEQECLIKASLGHPHLVARSSYAGGEQVWAAFRDPLDDTYAAVAMKRDRRYSYAWFTLGEATLADAIEEATS